jgi:hypothetical protein
MTRKHVYGPPLEGYWVVDSHDYYDNRFKLIVHLRELIRVSADKPSVAERYQQLLNFLCSCPLAMEGDE